MSPQGLRALGARKSLDFKTVGGEGLDGLSGMLLWECRGHTTLCRAWHVVGLLPFG